MRKKKTLQCCAKKTRWARKENNSIVCGDEKGSRLLVLLLVSPPKLSHLKSRPPTHPRVSRDGSDRTVCSWFSTNIALSRRKNPSLAVLAKHRAKLGASSKQI